MPKDRIYVRIRKSDELIRNHFSSINEADYPYEARRLLNKSIELEQKEKKKIESN